MTRHPTDDLTALLDGALAPDERARLEAHLASCAACRAERDRLAGAVALLERVPAPPEPSPSFEARFHARLAAERFEPGRRRPGIFHAWRWFAPWLAGAAAAAGMLVYAGVRRNDHERLLAEHLDLFENYEAVASLGAVDRLEDVEVVAHLHELGGGRP